MSRRWPSRLVALSVAGLVLATAGCEPGTDDEMAPPPTRTVTAGPSQSVPPAPATIPVGKGKVSPHDVVWAQGSVLHVGGHQVDLDPTAIDAFLVVPGGVFVLAEEELWFTDLSTVRGTGQTDVSGLQASADGHLLAVFDMRAGHELEQGYDTRTGRAIRGAVRTLSPQQRKQGPGRFEVRTSAGNLAVVDAETGRAVRLTNAPHAFELGAWTGATVFYGVGRLEVGRRAVVSCDAVAGDCRSVGRLTGPGPVVFGIGQ